MSKERVAEIFQVAGAAFTELGELTSTMRSASDDDRTASKWSDVEIAMLHEAVANFAADLKAVSERVRAKTVGQIKDTLRKKAFEMAGVENEAIEETVEETVEEEDNEEEEKTAESEPEAKRVKLDTEEPQQEEVTETETELEERQTEDVPTVEAENAANSVAVLSEADTEVERSGNGVETETETETETSSS